MTDALPGLARPAGLIDSHCHLDAAEFDADRELLIAEAGLAGMVVPAVERSNFDVVRGLAHANTGVVYALGIHPLYVQRASIEDLDRLDAALNAHRDDPLLVAVGEIGLDLFVPELREGEGRLKQEHFYLAQLKLARKYQLPVILHVRRAQDLVLKGLRQLPVNGGIAHAFNGSEQQAQAFLAQGCCLGFGGAMTYTRALQIRRLAQSLPHDAIVLETDAPDIAPEWLQVRPVKGSEPQLPFITSRNTPAQLPRIAACLAGLRGVSADEVAQMCCANTLRVLPKLRHALNTGHSA